MRAIIAVGKGNADVLQCIERPIPIPNESQLLVRVKACALNRADIMQRKGQYPAPPGESDVLGLEIAGEVVESCKQSPFQKGHRVFGLVGSGAYADYCLIDHQMAMPIPSHLSFIQAASIPEAFLTAQEALFTLAQLQDSESMLIHAGASGVGTAAIQLAKLKNAMIFATVGSDEKKEKIKAFGVKQIINYKQEDFACATLHTQLDVIIDFIGAACLEKHLQLLATQGRLILVGLMGGREAKIDLSLILAKRLQMKGLIMRSRPLDDKREISQRFQKQYLPLFAEGRLRPVVDSIFSFHDVRKAHEHMEQNKNVGKIILDLSN